MRNLISTILAKYSKEDVINLYINQNKSNKDLQELWGCKEGTVSSVLAHYDIHKDKAKANEIAFKTKAEKWGSIEDYNKYMIEKTNKTIIEKYGSKLEFSQHKSKAGKSFWNNVTPEQIEQRRIKISNTCKENYGVDYFCQSGKCRSTSGNNSKPNKDFESLLIAADIQYEKEFAIGSFSYDFKIENNLIEINPTYTHNSSIGMFHREPLDIMYHQQKSITASNAGYQCIHIFDWDDKYKILNLLLPRETIMARQCDIRQIGKPLAKEFLDLYHIQGYAKDEIRYGLFYHCQLVSVMTFGKPRYNRHADYELIRYCSSKNILGGAQKLFSHFISDYKPNIILSYCDNAKFSGKVYEKLGFSGKLGKPSKHWYNPKTKQHFTDNLLRKQGFSRLVHKCDAKDDNLPTNNNRELMLDAGFVEIYDAGQFTYLWAK